MTKRLLTLILVSLTFLYSCTSHEGDLSVYTVSNTDFTQILTVDGFAEPVSSRVVVCPPDIDGTIIFLLEEGTQVEEGDTVCIIEDVNLEMSYDEAFLELENERARINKVKADLAMQYALLEAQVKNNEADTKIAHLDSSQLEYSTPSQKRLKELELRRVAIEKAKFDKKLEALAVIQNSDIRRAELRVQRMENYVQSIKSKQDELVVRAPQSGLVSVMINGMTGNKNQVGDNIWYGQPIVRIPDMKTMKINITASEPDFKGINVGDSVYYKFDAMPGNMGWGKILQKSPVGRPVARNSKVKVFEIEASIDSVLQMPDPGFSAVCNIVQRVVKDTIVIPQVAIFEGDSIKFVYVKQGKNFEVRQIQTSLSFPKEAVISAGLKRGEVISLSKPDESRIEGKVLLPKIPTDSIPTDLIPGDAIPQDSTLNTNIIIDSGKK